MMFLRILALWSQIKITALIKNRAKKQIFLATWILRLSVTPFILLRKLEFISLQVKTSHYLQNSQLKLRDPFGFTISSQNILINIVYSKFKVTLTALSRLLEFGNGLKKGNSLLKNLGLLGSQSMMDLSQATWKSTIQISHLLLFMEKATRL